MGNREPVTVTFESGEVLVAKKTALAIGLSDDDGSSIFVWIPLSQIHTDEPAEGEYIKELVIPEWLADEHDLEYS